MIDYSKLLIKEYKYWDVKLHHDQNLLGRCLLWCKRDGVSDLFETTIEEREEFWEIGDVLQKALNKLFQPDVINYASLGMRTPHLHVHFFPRYKDKKYFLGCEFEDEGWGKHPLNNPSKEIPEDVLLNIRDAIKKELD